MGMPIRHRGHHHFDRISANIGIGGMGFDPSGMQKFIDYFVDGTNGNDNRTGRSWGQAVATIQAAMDKCSGRALNRIFVAPGGYTEAIQTPLNADAPFGQLIAWSPTGISGGAVWLASTGASTPVITVRARGWRISGFEIDSPTGAAAVLLQRNTGGTLRSSWTEIDHCLIGASITGKYGVEFEGADTFIHIHDNIFALCQATNGAAIFCNTTPFALPLLCTVEYNTFRENTNHIKMGASWGFNASIIQGNVFQGVGDKSATKILDLSGGRNNTVVGNYFGIANGTGSGQYDETNGKVLAGTNDSWTGNYINDGLTDKNPGSGS